MEKSDSGNNGSAYWILFILIPIIIGIVYLKKSSDEATDNVNLKEGELQLPSVAVPDTSVTFDMIVENGMEDTIISSEKISADTRTAMEAGDEDGYWDGWYDGAETGERTRYDENSSFATAEERRTYAVSYREGYEKGFMESMQQKKG